MKKLPLILHLSLFISILLGGAYLRLERLGTQSYWMDEGYTVNAVISGMQNGTRHFASILDSGSTYFCPMYCGLVNLEFRILNLEPTSVFAVSAYRSIAAMFGIMFILISYWIAKSFFKDKWIALLTMFLTSFSYIQIAWSRQARWYTELEVFFWLALGCFYGFLKRTSIAGPSPSGPIPSLPDSPLNITPSLHSPPTPLASERGALLRSVFSTLLSKLPSPPGEGVGGEGWKKEGLESAVKRSILMSVFWLTASLFFSTAAILTHPIAYALPAIMFVWFLIEKRPPLKEILIALVLVTTFVLFTEFGLGLHSLIGNLAKHFAFHQNIYYYASFYWRNYWILIILAMFGFFFADQKQRKAMTLLAIPFFAYFIGLSFFTEAIEYRYLFHTTVGWYVLGAIGIVAIFRTSHTYPLTPSLSSQTRKGGGTKQTLISKLPSRLREGLRVSVGIVGILILFYTHHLILAPQSFYWLEADDPASVGVRPYYAYTPQPDWNQAYATIQNQMQPGDIVISSHPHFNKIFLNQSGYWLAYDYMRQGHEIPKDQTHEYYVNAEVIHDLDELKALTASHHGFIVFDLQSTDGRIPKETIDYIKEHLTLLFDYATNNYSEIWVYRF